MGIAVIDTKFFSDAAAGKLTAYLVTSKLMELYLFGGVLTYLLLLFFWLQRVDKVEKAKME